MQTFEKYHIINVIYTIIRETYFKKTLLKLICDECVKNYISLLSQDNLKQKREGNAKIGCKVNLDLLRLIFSYIDTYNVYRQMENIYI